MKAHKMKIFTVLVAVFTIVPQVSQAAFVSSNAVRLSDTQALYTVTYSHNFANRDARLPILATRGDATNQFALEYDVITEHGFSTNTGTATGIVLSNAEVQNGQYVLPEGETFEFTFFTILNTTEPGSYAVEFKSLPFLSIRDGEVRQNSFDENLLQDHQTSFVTLNGISQGK